MENLNHFVSSRGIIKLCSNHNIIPVSGSLTIDQDLLQKENPPKTVYICTEALLNFSVNFLNLISNPFTLVSGDSDTSLSADIINSPLIQNILTNKNLIAWFAQNLATSHPKIHPLPIGMDYHTMWNNPGFWGINKQSPISQEFSLIKILSESTALNKRALLCYCNWQFALHRGDRTECYEKINKDTCFFEKHQTSRISGWQRQSQFAFVISPFGEGLDCHRTWEALLLGCIPIVRRSPIDELFVDLPVLIVNDWSEISEPYLTQAFLNFSNRLFDFNSLFTDYWRSKINGQDNRPLPPMTIEHFKEFICQSSC